MMERGKSPALIKDNAKSSQKSQKKGFGGLMLTSQVVPF
jgi:hypothetical protein